MTHEGMTDISSAWTDLTTFKLAFLGLRSTGLYFLEICYLRLVYRWMVEFPVPLLTPELSRPLSRYISLDIYLTTSTQITDPEYVLTEDNFSMQLLLVCFSLSLRVSLYIEHLASPNCYDRGVVLEYMAYIYKV